VVRASLTKGQFLKIFRWQQQLSLKRLSDMTEISIEALARLEGDDAGSRADYERLVSLLGCTSEMWDKVGVEPGFPLTETEGAVPSTTQTAFATQIERIATMPESFRHRQMQVIQKELGYIDG